MNKVRYTEEKIMVFNIYAYSLCSWQKLEVGIITLEIMFKLNKTGVS